MYELLCQDDLKGCPSNSQAGLKYLVASCCVRAKKMKENAMWESGVIGWIDICTYARRSGCIKKCSCQTLKMFTAFWQTPVCVQVVRQAALYSVTTVGASTAWKVKDVAMPGKVFPPPPLASHSKSEWCVAFARTKVPLCKTASTAISLSIDRPCKRLGGPSPPPSTRPASPTVEHVPIGIASPWSSKWVEACPKVKPASKTAIRVLLSTM
mmetsp:Transcript_183742/g.582890  ORF Transcript_183742/g.582890 Transcript_183742/m.582890 type:complete len:211 (-) Transcript_183742:473-1105(-)